MYMRFKVINISHAEFYATDLQLYKIFITRVSFWDILLLFLL